MDTNLHNTQIHSSPKFASDAVFGSVALCDKLGMKVNLKELRKKLGINQEEISERAGFSISQISRWESGANSIPSDKLPSLAVAYKCRVQDIFSDEGTEADVVPDNDNDLLDVVGEVSAGIWREREEWDVAERYQVPANTNAYKG